MKQRIPTKKETLAELARRNIIDYTKFVHPNIVMTPFHKGYYRILELFSRGDICKLIVTIPPQHGKSLGASIIMPSYILGLNPESRVAIASYNLSLASKFNKQIQRTMDTKTYKMIFPESRLKQSANGDKNYIRTSDEFDVIGHSGGVISVGREGALTGNQVDIMIIDDLYKDAMEANSPIIRDNTWDWYLSVVKTRLHNDSREIIVMTRWSEDDIVGRIERREEVVDVTTSDSAFFTNKKKWYRINFEAIKESEPTLADPRKMGEALWKERHNIELLNEKRALDSVTFDSMYQGNPVTKEGVLYGDNFRTYTILPDDIIKKGNYTDTADMGEDYLCSVCYELSKSGDIYITDVLYSQSGMEYTEDAVAAMLNRNAIRSAYIESNNGGRGFARNVRKLTPITKVEWFHQSANKESRIITNQATVLKSLIMPADWRQRWSEFYRDVSGYRRTFRANRFHDAADVLTGIVEYEVVNRVDKSLKLVGFSR